MCLQFLQLLKSSSSLLAYALCTLGSANSANSVNSDTTGIMNRISDTASKNIIVLKNPYGKMNDKFRENVSRCVLYNNNKYLTNKENRDTQLQMREESV